MNELTILDGPRVFQTSFFFVSGHLVSPRIISRRYHEVFWMGSSFYGRDAIRLKAPPPSGQEDLAAGSDQDPL